MITKCWVADHPNDRANQMEREIHEKKRTITIVTSLFLYLPLIVTRLSSTFPGR